ncbi:uncharacterized protein LOC142335049 [Convolutriloba macropyga]|uniref:uncharacterized protein LOC142335049 n=1 Tax=Convolutriloba macropyga TaxID=536237 RepID=UPI003F522C53
MDDETHCPECDEETEFFCSADRRCIKIELKCNRERDCYNGQDESPETCPENFPDLDSQNSKITKKSKPCTSFDDSGGGGGMGRTERDSNEQGSNPSEAQSGENQVQPQAQTLQLSNVLCVDVEPSFSKSATLMVVSSMRNVVCCLLLAITVLFSC